MNKSQRYAILVIWENGEEEYLKEGLVNIAKFSSRQRAQEQKDFMLMGMEDEVQSINVVPFPRKQDQEAAQRLKEYGCITKSVKIVSRIISGKQEDGA